MRTIAPPRLERRTTHPTRSPQVLGWAAVAVAVLCFSLGSTVVKSADAPGVMIAWWRLAATAVVWNLILLATGRRTTWANIKQCAIPGLFFGLNLSIVFTAMTHNSIAAVELILATSPFLVLPIGAKLFGEHLNRKALLLALVAFGGVGVVLLAAPASGEATLFGHLMALLGMIGWTGYIVSTRKVRRQLDVTQFMSAQLPVALVVVTPIAMLSGNLGFLPGHAWKYIGLLTLLTGMTAHGLLVFAQKSIPIGSIGIAQVSQPALAVMWSFVLLHEAISGWQLVGMVMMFGGLLSFILVNRRTAPPRIAFKST